VTNPAEKSDSDVSVSVNSEKTSLVSKSFKNGAIYLYIREDYKKPTWMCRLKIPGRKGYINRSTRTTDEHEAYKFADDLYHKELVRALGGPEQQEQRIGIAIDEYVQRFENQRSTLSIHYKLLLIERCRSFLEKKTFGQLDTRLISELYDELSKQSTRGSLSENSIKRIQSDL